MVRAPSVALKSHAHTENPAMSEIYEVFERISKKTGLPPAKIDEYVKAFESQEVYNR